MVNPVEEASCFAMLVYKNGSLGRQRVRDEVWRRRKLIPFLSSAYTTVDAESERVGKSVEAHRFMRSPVPLVREGAGLYFRELWKCTIK